MIESVMTNVNPLSTGARILLTDLEEFLRELPGLWFFLVAIAVIGGYKLLAELKRPITVKLTSTRDKRSKLVALIAELDPHRRQWLIRYLMRHKPDVFSLIAEDSVGLQKGNTFS